RGRGRGAGKPVRGPGARPPRAAGRPPVLRPAGPGDRTPGPGTRPAGLLPFRREGGRAAGPPGRERPVNLDDPFDIGLAGLDCRLEREGAPATPLDTRRWRADAGRSDRWLLDACQGPTVDLGCGPGRLVAALTERGVPALGVDNSARAIAQCSRRG